MVASEKSMPGSRSREVEREASPPTAAGALLSVRGLTVEFRRPGALLRRGGTFRAVDGVSFDMQPGEAVGLVGESGSGKTTVGRAVLGLIGRTAGCVAFNGVETGGLKGRDLMALRRKAQIVFQDPGSSLSPRMRIGSILLEPMEVHGIGADGRERRAKAVELLELCGLSSEVLERYPHELSGGQKQRIAIARALTLGPSLLVCDEPTSALDVSVQAQVINLLSELRARLGLALLFISHDIHLVGYLCDRIAVMQAGRIVESGPAERVLREPEQAYTKALLAAVPRPEPRRD